jgi:hypothetical protein
MAEQGLSTSVLPGLDGVLPAPTTGSGRRANLKS